MNNSKANYFHPRLTAALFAAWLCTLAGFMPVSGRAGSSEKAAAPVNGGVDGARLWAQTCVGCHNIRPPGTYSGAQWEVIVHHMRVRARLTGTEARAIADFLKSGR